MTASTLPVSSPVARIPAPRRQRDPAPGAAPDRAGSISRTTALLASHVPLTLLMDLSDPTGPHSRELFSGETADLAWLRA